MFKEWILQGSYIGQIRKALGEERNHQEKAANHDLHNE